jgi:hypothetical protein
MNEQTEMCLNTIFTEAARNAIPSTGRYVTAGCPLPHWHCLGDEPLQAITDAVGEMKQQVNRQCRQASMQDFDTCRQASMQDFDKCRQASKQDFEDTLCRMEDAMRSQLFPQHNELERSAASGHGQHERCAEERRG